MNPERIKHGFNGTMETLARNAVQIVVTRAAMVVLLGFATWYGTKMVGTLEDLNRQVTIIAEVAAVLKSQGADRDRRLDRVEGGLDSLIQRGATR